MTTYLSNSNHESSITTYSEMPYTIGRIINNSKNQFIDREKNTQNNKYNRIENMQNLDTGVYDEYGLEKEDILEINDENENENDSYFKEVEESPESEILENEKDDDEKDDDYRKEEEDDDEEDEDNGKNKKETESTGGYQSSDSSDVSETKGGSKKKRYGNISKIVSKYKSKKYDSDFSDDSDDSDSDDDRFNSKSKRKLMKKAYMSYRNQIPYYKNKKLEDYDIPEDTVPKNYTGLMPSWLNSLTENHGQDNTQFYDNKYAMSNPTFKFHMMNQKKGGGEKEEKEPTVFKAPDFLINNVDPVLNPYNDKLALEFDVEYEKKGGGKEKKSKVVYYDQSLHPYLNQMNYARELNENNSTNFFF